MFECAIIFLISLAGGVVPLLVRWSDRVLHSALALSTGIFLGAVFLHLLPSLSALAPAAAAPDEVEAAPETGAVQAGDGGAAAADADHADHADHADGADGAGHAGHAHGALAIWFFVLVGVLSVYFIEALVFRTHDHDDLHRHRAVGYAALLGLSVHGLTNGIGLSAASQLEGLELPVFISIIAHKAFESFSLASVFLLAEFRRSRIVVTMILFSGVTPAGVLLGRVLIRHLEGFGIAVATALAAGTFLYVCLCELLPEVFHHKEDGFAKIVLMSAGIAVMALVSGAGA